MLQIRNLRKSFGDLQVLKSIDLDVNRGDVVAILGPSGSGKTTMLRCLNFLEKSDGGTMLFDDRRVDLARVTHAEANALRRRTGFVFQSYNPRLLCVCSRWSSAAPKEDLTVVTAQMALSIYSTEALALPTPLKSVLSSLRALLLM